MRPDVPAGTSLVEDCVVAVARGTGTGAAAGLRSGRAGQDGAVRPRWADLRGGRRVTGRPPRRAAVLAGVLIAAMSVPVTGCAAPAGGHAVAATGQHRSAKTPGRPVSHGRQLTATPTPLRPDASPSVVAVPPPPGNLPQTRTFPSTRTHIFAAEMTDLWAAVLTGRARLAVQAFFPLAAYKQVKAIYDPAADWHNRLLTDFRLDVAAAHHVVGRRARLVRVIVPSAQAAWIDPGACFNSVGYWHVCGARMAFRQHGQLRSIGIASLISWRGRWYVVHFGAVLRTGNHGIVDQPAAGIGVPGPAGGC
jgi:hypothetical protein